MTRRARPRWRRSPRVGGGSNRLSPVTAASGVGPKPDAESESLLHAQGIGARYRNGARSFDHLVGAREQHRWDGHHDGEPLIRKPQPPPAFIQRAGRRSTTGAGGVGGGSGGEAGSGAGEDVGGGAAEAGALAKRSASARVSGSAFSRRPSMTSKPCAVRVTKRSTIAYSFPQRLSAQGSEWRLR
jgi:hypothetical protein